MLAINTIWVVLLSAYLHNASGESHNVKHREKRTSDAFKI